MKTKTKVLSIVLFLSVSIMLVSCKKQKTEQEINTTNLKIKDTEIIGTKMFKGFFLGADFSRNEMYIRLSKFRDDTHTVGIIDLQTEKIKKTFSLRRGAFEAPGEFSNPTYMQFLDSRYYIVDWFFKIMVFEHELTYLYTTMFRDSKIRYFFDFYKKNGEFFFVIGDRKHGPKESICSVEIYKMIERRNLKLYEKIRKTYHKSLDYSINTKKTLLGELWSSSWGFEKDGKIYSGNGAERKYFVYDLNQKNLESVQLSFLKAKKYTDNDAKKIIYEIYESGEVYENLGRRFNIKYIPTAYPGKIYYFGFYDVGKNKLGIAGDLDLERMSFRLDIIGADSKEYLESIWLPVGHGFLRHLSEGTRGLFLIRINVDKGIYVWVDNEGEEWDPLVKLTRFKIKKD
ncbi:MAG: hypothetical protein ISS16_12390 [Ignavibacteria bacterium]|nr:hypothetical protein [Ignavibacteria bacterium]